MAFFHLWMGYRGRMALGGLGLVWALLLSCRWGAGQLATGATPSPVSPQPVPSSSAQVPSPSSTPSPQTPSRSVGRTSAPPSWEGDRAFWEQEVPQPPDAQMMPVVEGVDMAFVTQMSPEDIFGLYADWLAPQGWVRVPPETMASLVAFPQDAQVQVWRRGNGFFAVVVREHRQPPGYLVELLFKVK